MTTTLDGRVLVAEDDPDIQWILRHHLSRAGADVAVVTDGREAVNAAIESRTARDPFGLVVMDVEMPGMDGLTAAALLRSIGWRWPIIALTAHTGKQERDRCLESGCDDFLPKPTDKDELLRTCAAWLAVSRAMG